jgi:hypothetical protein
MIELETRIFSRELGVLVLLFITLGGCTTLSPVPTSTPILLPTAQPRPDFIRGVGPEESSVVSLKTYEAEYSQVVGMRDLETGYASTVCVRPDISHLVQKGDYFADTESVLERVELRVDDVQREVAVSSNGLLDIEVLRDGEVYARFGGPYAFCWHAPVGVGTHVVSFQFRQTSGDIKEYSWYFAVTED